MIQIDEVEAEDEVDISPALTTTTASLNPIGPDLTVYISATPDKGRYAYRLVDNSTDLSHICVRVLPQVDDTGLALMAAYSSLMAIAKNRINGLLVERYGFSNRSAAVASRKRIHVELVVTDPDLATLATLVTAPDNEGTLEFFRLRSEQDYRIWNVVLSQTKRFDTTWSSIPADHPIIAKVERWADNVLARANHAGPIYSPQFRFYPPALICPQHIRS